MKGTTMKGKEGDELGLAAFYLRRALEKEGCPVCRRVRESEERWIWTVLYEMTSDPSIHKRFSQSLGLCRDHATLMAEVVETRELLTPSAVTEEAADRESWLLGQLLLDREFWEAFRRGEGLCLPHFMCVYRMEKN